MSDWKKGAAARRDARNIKDPNDTPKPGASKKDTKKWCRGKVGVEHKPECRDYQDVKNSFRGHALGDKMFQGWKLLICTTCGKELDHYYPMTFAGREPKPPPPWVT